MSCRRAIQRLDSATSQQMRGVLLQAAETPLHQAELPLDHAKRVLHPRAHAGLVMLVLLQLRLGTPLSQLGDVARPGSDVPLPLFALYTRLCAAVAGVDPDLFFLAAKQVGDLFDVCFIGRGGRHRVNQADVGVPCRCAPSCRSAPGCPSWSGASPGRLRPRRSSWNWGPR